MENPIVNFSSGGEIVRLEKLKVLEIKPVNGEENLQAN